MHTHRFASGKLVIRRFVLVGIVAASTAAAIGVAPAGTHGVAANGSVLDAVKSRGVLRAGIRTDFPPHSYYDASGHWVGFDIDIAAAVAKQLGVKLEKVKVDELTRISYLKDGKIDIAAASMNHTISRDNEVDFSETYFFSYQTFLVKKDSGIRMLKDLVGKTVGFSRG